MKLIAKAKPVKIRIKSGGKEHTSLDSLRRNFNISDILPLLDGRLERWLYQQGVNNVAKLVVNTRTLDLNTPQGILDLIKIFFADYIAKNNIDSLFDLIQNWCISSEFKINNDYLISYLIYLDLNYTKIVYKHKTEWKCSNIDWNEVFTYQIETKHNEDAEAFYIYGKLLLTNSNKSNKAFEYIDKAARLGWKEAYDFLIYRNKEKETAKRQATITKSEGRFRDVDKVKITSWINHQIKLHEQSVNFSNISYSPQDYSTEKEKKILDFICQCWRIIWYATYDSLGKASDKALVYFSSNPTGLLKNEKLFIHGLIYHLIQKNPLNRNNNFDKTAESYFDKAAKSNYPLAQYMLSNEELIDGVKFKYFSFQNQILFIINHLFDYE